MINKVIELKLKKLATNVPFRVIQARAPNTDEK